MANKPINMLQLRRILQLKLQGKSNREIAFELCKSRDTVNGYVKQLSLTGKSLEDLLKLNDEELSSLAFNEPSCAKTDWRFADLQQRIPSLCDELKKPHATRMILWEEYRQRVAEGYGYAQFCEHLSRFLETRKAVMIFDHEPAASMMFDFAGDKIALTDYQTGEITWCPVLVCVLPFSGFTYIEALLSANHARLLKALNNALCFIGGVPQSAKTDNMKQVVKKSNRYEPAFEELAQQWSLYYGTTMMAARVRKPRDKASVESHVNAVYNRIYAPLRNSIQRNYHITLGEDWHHYSVPYQYIGKMVQIIYDTDHVEIYLDNVRIACYRRNYNRNGHTTLPEHMPPGQNHYAQIKGYNRDYFIEKAIQIGSNTASAISKILDQKIFIEQTYNSCLGVLRLGEKYGSDRLEAACRRALTGYKVTYMGIKNILERNLDKVPLQTDLFITIPDHENIRGAQSYQ